MTTQLCQPGCLGAYTTKLEDYTYYHSLAWFFQQDPDQDIPYLIEVARRSPECLERRRNDGGLSYERYRLIHKLKVIAVKNLHITVTDTQGNGFGSVKWWIERVQIWEYAKKIDETRHLRFGSTLIAPVNDDKRTIIFSCRTCLDEAIAESLKPVLPRRIVEIVQECL